MPASRRSSILVCLILAAATAAVYAPVRNHEFVNFDDDLYVTQNSLVQKGITWDGIVEILKRPALGFWHPLTLLSHMQDCHLFGLSSGAHHLTNLFLHILNTLLLFLFLKSATGSIWRSAFAAALFSLHPLHVESVAWVSERKDLLSTSFWMLALHFYMRYVRGPNGSAYALVMVSFILGLMAKPMVVTLPFVLLLLDFWPLNRMSPDPGCAGMLDRRRLVPLLLEKTPMIALSAAAGLLTVYAEAQHKAIAPLENNPFLERMGNAALSYCIYLLKTLWPAGLAVHYPYTGMIPPWKIAGASLLLAALTLIFVHEMRRRPFLLFGWLWFLGTLLPVIGLVQIGSHAMADRYTYIPLVGIFIAIAWGIPYFLLPSHRARFLGGLSAAAVLLLLAAGTRLQVAHWKDSTTLFEHALLVTPDNLVAHNNLGAALAAGGKLQQARMHLEEALRISPYSWDSLNNIGNILCREGRAEEALPYYEAALRINPDSALIHNNLGTALASLNRFLEAIPHYESALRLKPDFADPMKNLGRAFQGIGNRERGIEQFRRAVMASPTDCRLHTDLGNALAQNGLYDEAEKSFRESLRLCPDKAAAAYNGLATLYAGKGRFEKAVEMRKRAIQINPCDGEAHYRLAVEAYLLGDGRTAVQHCDRAIALGFKEVEPEFLRRIESAGLKSKTD